MLIVEQVFIELHRNSSQQQQACGCDVESKVGQFNQAVIPQRFKQLEFQPQWTVRRGVEELYDAYRKHHLTLEDFNGSRLMRIKHIQNLQSAGLLDEALRWTEQARQSSPA